MCQGVRQDDRGQISSVEAQDGRAHPFLGGIQQLCIAERRAHREPSAAAATAAAAVDDFGLAVVVHALGCGRARRRRLELPGRGPRGHQEAGRQCGLLQVLGTFDHVQVQLPEEVFWHSAQFCVRPKRCSRLTRSQLLPAAQQRPHGQLEEPGGGRGRFARALPGALLAPRAASPQQQCAHDGDQLPRSHLLREFSIFLTEQGGQPRDQLGRHVARPPGVGLGNAGEVGAAQGGQALEDRRADFHQEGLGFVRPPREGGREVHQRSGVEATRGL
mmetsp:Transcript_55128/g.158515  ORF Transcript_55128/g.158515 Transcript_55128/m.158515 type:complete len:274 (+) Transcript_55128:773-1594(+)